MSRRPLPLLHPRARARRAAFICAAFALLALIQHFASAVFVGA